MTNDRQNAQRFECKQLRKQVERLEQSNSRLKDELAKFDDILSRVEHARQEHTSNDMKEWTNLIIRSIGKAANKALLEDVVGYKQDLLNIVSLCILALDDQREK